MAATAQRPQVRVEKLIVTTENCDRHPGAKAAFTVYLPSGRLLYFCGHCARKHFPDAPSVKGGGLRCSTSSGACYC